MMLTKRFERLNALAQINSAATYLEIGVARGATFNRVNVEYKVAVDPNFQFNVQDYAGPKTIFHQVTSDHFFSTLASRHQKFDLIYLDGLHTFEQTFRDFCASLAHAHSNTVWLLDDTVPSSRLAANPNRTFARRARRLFGIKDKRWMGDVFKVIFAIHDFFPQYSYATFREYSQTVVWLETRRSFTPHWNSLEKISRLRYGDFTHLRDSLMSLMESPKIMEAVQKSRNK